MREGYDVKIAIDAFRLVDEAHTSGANYVAELTTSLASQRAVEAISLLLPHKVASPFKYEKVFDVSKVNALWPTKAVRPAASYRTQLHWIQRVIPNLINGMDFDWFISPYHQAPLRLMRPIKVLTVIHDVCGLYPSAGYPWYKKGAYIHLANFVTSLLRSDAFVYVSMNTKTSFERLFPWAKQRLSQVILNEIAFSQLAQDQAEHILSRLNLQKNSYFLAFAAPGRRKGLDLTISAFKLYRESGGCHSLVLISPPSFMEALKSTIDLDGLTDSTFILPKVTNDQRDALYSGALALLFPSRCEGFGYPIIEAMAQGCPAIAWKNSPAEELIGNTVPLLMNLNSSEIAALLHYYARVSTSGRESLHKELQMQAVRFNGSTLGRNFVDLMDSGRRKTINN